ncbi:MAG: hypothetical protein MSC31_09150 [Solirubrobacteraceae bacterium MAG38_C4-C5]|nr:hypothetical protein [Candidatus Siliceabacter maunaloa]
MATNSQSRTWLAGGALAALGAIIALLFTDSGILAGLLGIIALVFIATGLTAGRGKT